MAVRRLFWKPHQRRTEGRVGHPDWRAGLVRVWRRRSSSSLSLYVPSGSLRSSLRPTVAPALLYTQSVPSLSLRPRPRHRFSPTLTPSRQPWTAQRLPPRCEPHRQIRSRIQTQTMRLSNPTRPPPPRRSQTRADRRRLSSLTPIKRLRLLKRSPPILSTTS